MKRALVLCTGNSCRSQMAEAFWNELGNGEWEAMSAGSNPAGYVHAIAIEVMRDLEIDLSTAISKHVEQFKGEHFDVVVTVCDNAEKACPVFPNAKRMLHWPFDDPADFEGSDEDRRAEFTRVRDEILSKISSFLGEPSA